MRVVLNASSRRCEQAIYDIPNALDFPELCRLDSRSFDRDGLNIIL